MDNTDDEPKPEARIPTEMIIIILFSQLTLLALNNV